LLKVSVKDDALTLSTIDPEVLNIKAGKPTRMKAAFAQHKDDPKLFGEPVKFGRLK
jgi:hypothetical protein